MDEFLFKRIYLVHSKKLSVATLNCSLLYSAVVGALRLEQQFVFVLQRSWQALVALMAKYQAFVQIELNEVEVEVLNTVLLQQVLVPQHVRQIHLSLVSESVFESVSVAVEDPSWSTGHVNALLLLVS